MCSLEEIIAAVPQGSILVLILFIIFVSDLFLLPKTCNTVNYADDNTLYATGDCFEVINEKLFFRLSFSPVLVSWKLHDFKSKKRLLHVTRKKFRNQWRFLLPANSIILVIAIKKTDSQKFLGVIIDHDLNYEEHIKSTCKMVGEKLNARQQDYLI